MNGVILAGGKSSRMGQDKGLMTYKDKPLIRYSLDLLEPLVQNLLIVSSNPSYAEFGFPVYPDIYENRGPLAGIYTGLSKSDEHRNIILACDTPFVQPELLEHLAGFEGYDVVIPSHEGRTEQLVGIYSKDCMPAFKERIENGQLKIKDAFEDLSVLEVEIDPSLSFYSPGIFQNMNSPEDLSK